MMNLDPVIVEFVSGNWIALSLALGVLKIIAKITPWVWDDGLLTLISGLYSMIKGKGPVSPPKN